MVINIQYHLFLGGILSNTLTLDTKSSDAKASKCHLKFSSKMINLIIFMLLFYLNCIYNDIYVVFNATLHKYYFSNLLCFFQQK